MAAGDTNVGSRPPKCEQILHDRQTNIADDFPITSSFLALLKVAFQVGPANLSLFQRQSIVTRPTVADDNPGDRFAQ